MAKLSIIVPTYNERENLLILTSRIGNALAHLDYEIIIVDDNSPDGTGDLAEELARENPIKVVHRQGKLGLASAVIDGFRHASGDVLGVIDADLQHPPEKLPDLFKEIASADVVIASRYVKGGGMEDWTFRREMISKVSKMLPRFLFAEIRKVKDPLSGFFLFRKEVIEGVELNPIGYKILLEILVKGKHTHVVEVPFVFKGRERGASNLNLKEEINYLKHLYRLAVSKRELSRFARFCLVGGSGVLVNMGLYWILTRQADVRDIVAQPFGIELSILTNFALNELWTFKDRRDTMQGSVPFRALKFNLICGVGAIVNFGVFYFLTRAFEVFDMIALLCAIIAATLFNFIMNKWLTWH